MALSKIDTPALVADAVDNTILDVADNFAFTGTVTGAGIASPLATNITYTTQNIKDSFNVTSNTDGGTGRSYQNLTNNFNSTSWSSPTQGSYQDQGRTTVTQDLTDSSNRNGGTNSNRTVMFRPENGSSQDCHNLSAMYAGDLA